MILPYVDSGTKEKTKVAVKELSNDEDIDVRFYANRFTGLAF